MNDWLEKDDLPEDTKATMYAQQLQRVNQLKNQVFRPEPSPVQMITHTELTMTSESNSTTPSQQLNATDKQIIDSVPKTMQNRAKLLLQKLRDHSDVIRWNDNGQLVLKGSIVPNSNIVDLVNDVMRKRKGFNPKHSNTFAKVLAKINVPEDYLRNPDRIDSIYWYDRLQDSQAPEPSFVSETPTEVPQKTQKSNDFCSCLWKMAKSTLLIELLVTLCVYFSNTSSIKYNLGVLTKFMYKYNIIII